MASEAQTTTRRLLAELDGGNREALDELFPLVYQELSQVAHRLRQRWHGDSTLNTTALIHETYLKLVGRKRIRAESRAHFLALAAKAMRHILINYARARRTQKRGGELELLSLDEMKLPRSGRDSRLRRRMSSWRSMRRCVRSSRSIPVKLGSSSAGSSAA